MHGQKIWGLWFGWAFSVPLVRFTWIWPSPVDIKVSIGNPQARVLFKKGLPNLL
jgi:hypothetical protein